VPQRNVEAGQGLLEGTDGTELICQRPQLGGRRAKDAHRVVEHLTDQQRTQHVEQNIDPVAATPRRKVTPDLAQSPAAVVGLDPDQEVVAGGGPPQRGGGGGGGGGGAGGKSRARGGVWGGVGGRRFFARHGRARPRATPHRP